MTNVPNTSLVFWELVSLLVPVLVLALVFFILVRGFRTGNIRRASEDAVSAGPSAKEMLDRRYASGELSREEYLQVKEDIAKEENAR